MDDRQRKFLYHVPSHLDQLHATTYRLRCGLSLPYRIFCRRRHLYRHRGFNDRRHPAALAYKLLRKPIGNELRLTFWVSMVLGGLTLIVRDGLSMKPTII